MLSLDHYVGRRIIRVESTDDDFTIILEGNVRITSRGTSPGDAVVGRRLGTIVMAQGARQNQPGQDDPDDKIGGTTTINLDDGTGIALIPWYTFIITPDNPEPVYPQREAAGGAPESL